MTGYYYPQWNLPKNQKSSLREQLLASSSIHEHDELIHEPSALKDYNKALERIFKAIENKERIIVFGDYDVDGTVGTSILVEILTQVGALVSYRIPHRKNDGYGLKKYFIDDLAKKEVSLIITVDNGISAVEEVAHAKEKGIDIIITDHHIVPAPAPDAYAIVNHQQDDCAYPYPHICGAAIAYKLALGIAKHYMSESEYKEYAQKKLDLVALATVADCVPLHGENRMLVKQGLKVLQNTKNTGLKAMAEAGNIRLDLSDTDTCGFQIGPRINAGGRLAQAYHGLQLLLGDTSQAKVLEDLNNTRKELVKNAIEEADSFIEENTIIIKSHSEWHAGIIGLIAGKLTEKYHLPSIVLEEVGDCYTASCRAPEGFHLVDFLTEFKDYFVHFGGHAQAAGFSISAEKLEEFQSLAEKRSKEILGKLQLKKSLNITAELSLEDLQFETLNIIEAFEPFGIGNPKPKFLIRNCNVTWSAIGKEYEHLRGFLATPNGENITIIKFFSADILGQLQSMESYDIVCHLSKNTWNGQTSLQLELVDIAL